MKIKKSTIWLLFILLRLPAVAQQISNCQASPYPITVKQADGSSITIIGKGSLLNSWTETVDGYTVVNKNGNYEYAQKVNGKLVPTGIVARNAGDRKPTETAFLQKVNKSIKPDAPAKTNSPAFFESKQKITGTQRANFPATGRRKALLILIQYPDLPHTYNHFFFQNLMNHHQFKGIGSFKDFFYRSSVGSLFMEVDVVGWYTAAYNYSYYGRENGDRRATDLVREAVDAAEAAGVDFSAYDNDKDGNVDGIMVAHAGPGAEEGSQLQYIWSHRWELSVGNNHVKYDGVWIDDYIINPEKRIYTNDIVGRGIFCHEFGHLLGLPDLYDIDGSSEGLGEWSLMAGAGWLGNEHTPGNLCV
ncbi:MAG: M6 family metalloprotease domain-containing protein [Bacteroidota bacterium]|nr:M6 family metalloprotease domain-containing protein [Bacteroidota bacterium]